jgi:DHA2 family lincomycin resistance protein-like MFS transporter
MMIAVAAFAAFIATFNETFLNVALAPIMQSCAVDAPVVQWLTTAYMLGAAVMVPVSAFAYRSLPTRPLFVGTVGLLVAGSLVCALAGASFEMLLAGRIVQALGTGLLIPIGMNITLEVAPREKLGAYMGLMGAMTTIGPSSSVLIAGLLLAMGDWHLLFWVFAALSALCLLSGCVFLGNIARLTHPRLDAASVALAALGLVGVLYGVSTAFGGEALAALGAGLLGVIMLALFVHRQGRLAQPLIDLSTLRIAPFAVGVIVNMLSLITMFAMNIIIPIFMQSVLGVPALSASLTLFPAIALSCVLSPLAGRVYDRYGASVLLPLGFLLLGVFACALSLLIAGGDVLLLAVLYVPVIGGSALIIGPVQSLALSKLSHEQSAHGITVMSTGFQVAGCLGSSLFVGIFSAVSAAVVQAGVAPADGAARGFLTAGLVVCAIALVGLALSLLLTRLAARAVELPEAAAAATTTTAAHVLRDIMKADVYSLGATDTLEDALRLFVDKQISGAPVVNAQGKVSGFISDGDIMRHLADQHPSFVNSWSLMAELHNDDFGQALEEAMALSVGQVANKHVICVNANDDLGAICKVLVDRHLRKAPVLENGRMVGIINRSNISRYALAQYLGKR